MYELSGRKGNSSLQRLGALPASFSSDDSEGFLKGFSPIGRLPSIFLFLPLGPRCRMGDSGTETGYDFRVDHQLH